MELVLALLALAAIVVDSKINDDCPEGEKCENEFHI